MNTPAPTEQNADATSSPVNAEALLDDVLVEEVSIDGMCGVY